MDKFEAPPFFLVGCDRSGTTLLAAMLDRHSRIAVPPETHFFRSTCTGDKEPSPPLSHGQLLTQFASNHRAADMGLDARALAARFETLDPTYRNLFLSAVGLYAQARNKCRVGEKTPGHLARIPRILHFLPEAKVICVVRDGRDVARSLVRVAWSHRDQRRHCLRWNRASRHVLRYGRTFSNNVRMVLFEDLLRDPQSQLSDLCEFLGECYEPQQLDASVPTGVVPQQEKRWKQKAAEPLDPSRAHAWRQDTSEHDKHLMNAAMGHYLRAFGYPDTTLAGCPIQKRAGLWVANQWCRLWYRK